MDFEQFEHINFRLPGPTPLPPSVRTAMARPAIHHRGPLLKSIMSRLTDRLRQVHRTTADVLIWPGSGSAGWEIAITNLLSPGDRVIVTTIGDFGDRFANVATRFGLEVHRLAKPWGEAVAADELSTALDAVPDCRAVLITHNETSTGVTNPLPELAAVARSANCLVIVDAVSSAAALPLQMDDWGLDFIISGSQKAWMCPPGLAICAVGPAAWNAYERSRYHRYFWDIRDAAAMSAKNMTVTTPPLNLLFALDAALDLMFAEGLENVWARHARIGEWTRRHLAEAGFRLFADPAYASNSLTAIRVPDGESASGIVEEVLAKHNVLLQIGQGALAEQIIRIGHMGWVTVDDVRVAADALIETVALPSPV